VQKVKQVVMKMDKAWFIQSRQGNIKDHYFFEKKLGSGGYGAVYLAKHKLTGNKANFYQFCESCFRQPSRGQGHAEGPYFRLRIF
jgi:hypothetical protein